MKKEVVKITPAMARQWLERNTDNRPLRRTKVEGLRQSFMRGEYVRTHVGIAFDEHGTLLDGQHRLAAIAQMPDGWLFEMEVTHGMDRQKTFRVIDTMQTPRTASDVLGVDRGIAEVAAFFARIHFSQRAGITPSAMVRFVDWVSHEYAELVEFCPANSRTWSSAPVRAAAILCMKYNDQDYALLNYRALVHKDFGSMSPIVQVLFKSYLGGRVTALNSPDLFSRCLKAFNPKKQNMSRITVKDPTAAIIATRGLLAEEMSAPVVVDPPKTSAQQPKKAVARSPLAESLALLYND